MAWLAEGPIAKCSNLAFRKLVNLELDIRSAISQFAGSQFRSSRLHSSWVQVPRYRDLGVQGFKCTERLEGWGPWNHWFANRRWPSKIHLLDHIPHTPIYEAAKSGFEPNVLGLLERETSDSRIGDDQVRSTYSTTFRILRSTKPPNQRSRNVDSSKHHGSTVTITRSDTSTLTHRE